MASEGVRKGQSEDRNPRPTGTPRFQTLIGRVPIGRGDSMVLGTMGLEIIFSEGLLIDLKGLAGPLRFSEADPDSG
jgi:hypothetical protein